MKKLLFLLLLVAVLSGCRTESPEGACTLENFVAVAISEDVPREIPARDKSSKYEIVCRDADKVSCRATEYQYTGVAHGSTLVRVGTIDRRTGRKWFSYREIFDSICGEGYCGDEGAIRSHVSRLREKLPSGGQIDSKRGRGYALIG